MSFCYFRVVRFHETDAAGVVYFANLLTLCHEAYEASLAAAVDLRQFFSGAGETAVPIVHAEADFYQPLFCGDAIAITLTPKQLSPHSFEVTYSVTAQRPHSPPGLGEPLAQALTRHVCISTQGRRRHPLTPDLARWIDSLSEPAAPAD